MITPYLNVWKVTFYIPSGFGQENEVSTSIMGENRWNIEIKTTQISEDTAVKVLEVGGWIISQLGKG